MRRLITLLSIAVICGALSCPSADARGRNNNGGGGGNTTQQTTDKGNAPARAQRGKSNNNTARPGNGGNHGNQGNVGTGRPNNGGNQGNQGNVGTGRPNNGGNHGNHGNVGTARPNNGGNHGNGHGHVGPAPRPNHGFGPGPGGHSGRPGSVAAIPNHRPPRPLMMQHRPPYARPVPPPAFRPGPRYPTIRTILGLTIGSAINMSLNYLFDAGYYVTGYTNNAVYLNDVVQLNMLWPNATLYYHGGVLAGSEFVYSTPYYDTSRYYSAYNVLTNAYGLPVVHNNISGGFNCTWFGYDGNYVTLQFQSGVAANGTNRYYTMLSFGS